MLVAELPDGTLIREDDAAEMYQLITEEVHHLYRLLAEVDTTNSALWHVPALATDGKTSICHIPVVRQHWRNATALRRLVRDHWLPQQRETAGKSADRLLGWLNLVGDEAAIAALRDSVTQVNHYKEKFALYNRTLLSDTAVRTRYLRRQYPGIIMRSVHRRIELTNEMDYRCHFAWTSAQYRATPINVEYVKDLLDSQHKHDPDFDYEGACNQLARRLSDPGRFSLVQIADIRVHPVQGIVYRDEEGARRVRPVKCHSPLVITNNPKFVCRPPSDFVFGGRPVEQRQNKKRRTVYHPILPHYSIYQREVRSA
ncbi:DNA replication terminus site-binding protein [Photobacterium ganghwense]|uniref:DNA replication terminus site-binding protein n=1 Tax=Photobacterium ganghwense TaxID=320778 RepID=UPI001A8D3DCA|nr:DNA replication terminus site-binding protein [Photobacterium ganghwense]QSV17509.1 hypothetical protein FH974_25730 [Photobacterium ganghwense]